MTRIYLTFAQILQLDILVANDHRLDSERLGELVRPSVGFRAE